MGYPMPPILPYPEYPVAAPRRSGVDITASIILLVLTVLLGVVAAFFGLFSLAFLDYCPPETCSVEGAVTAVLASLAVAGAVGIGGLVVTIIRLTRRRVAWPFALVTLGACTLVLLIGGVGFVTAVGA
jgi:hypothetical protein